MKIGFTRCSIIWGNRKGKAFIKSTGASVHRSDDAMSVV